MIGAGAIGGLLGGLLAKGGCRVWLLDTWEDHIAAIRENGLILQREGDEVDVVQLAATTQDPDIDQPDVVLIQVKAPDTKAAAMAARPLLGPDTIVVTLQNGIGHQDLLEEIVGPGRVVQGVTYHSAEITAPGKIRHTASGSTIVGEIDGRRSQRVEQLAAVFIRGFACEVSDDISAPLWSKLLINAVFNPICAITKCTPADIVTTSSAQDLVAAVCDEVAAVSRAHGVTLPWPDPMSEVVRVGKKAGASVPSMLQDLSRGRMTEVEAINGQVVARGAAMGIPTPVNRALTALVHLAEAVAVRS